MKHNSIATQTTLAATAINNALKYAEVKAAVLAYGYTVTRLNQGKALHTAAVAAVEHATAMASDKQSATRDLQQAFDVAKDTYQALAKVARAIFVSQPNLLTALGLDQRMPRSMDEFALAAQKLFASGSYPDGVADGLEANGYPSDKLSGERAKIAEFNNARETKSAAKGDAEQAVRDQRAALKELHQWYMAFRKIARVALRSQPELLEKLGIMHRSAKTKAQRGAAAKAAATRAKNKALQKAA